MTKAAATVKKEAEKAVAAKQAHAAEAKQTVVLQYLGKEIPYSELVDRAVDAWKAAGKDEAALKEVKVYVKPEENKAYYVLNDGEEIGSFDI